jgi:hypothetical protein
VDGWWTAKGHSVLDGSAVCHREHYFFIACILPQKKRGPLVDMLYGAIVFHECPFINPSFC